MSYYMFNNTIHVVWIVHFQFIQAHLLSIITSVCKHWGHYFNLNSHSPLSYKLVLFNSRPILGFYSINVVKLVSGSILLPIP